MEGNEVHELHRKHRPSLLKHVVGQEATVKVLIEMVDNGRIPQALLFTGPSGCGKTTLARILVGKLRCEPPDFQEINAAKDRGIDMVKALEKVATMYPVKSPCRVWLLDECFPAGTLVNTSSGAIPIESIRPGDEVVSLSGLTTVRAVQAKTVPLWRTVRVNLSNGRSLVTTSDHEVMTTMGWVPAKDLTGHCIVSLPGYSMGNEAQHDQEMRMVWGELHPTTGAVVGGLRGRVGGEVPVPHQLQERHWAPRSHDLCGGRWESPSVEQGFVARCQKNRMSERVRVVSVWQAELGLVTNNEGDEPSAQLYDLQVTGHPSYFADGVPVHNCHMLTREAQASLLKILEDVPKDVYFMLATTDPGKLTPTVRGRCTSIDVKPIKPKDLKDLVLDVADLEGADLTSRVVDAVVEAANGSARMALNLLGKVILIDGEQARLELIEAGDSQKQAIDLARKLLDPKARWPEVAAILKDLTDEAETTRRVVLGYMNSVLLGGGKLAPRAAAVIGIFRDHLFDCGTPGLSYYCYTLLHCRDGFSG